jgi:methylmalonyl-CoA mutase
MKDVTLARDFPAASRDDWRALVAAVLRRSGSTGTADPEEALSSLTYDGISRRPLYTASDAATPADLGALEGSTDGWDVRQFYAGPDAVAINRAVLADLTGGVMSVWIKVGAGGVAVADLGQALDGVALELAPVVLDAGAETVGAAAELLALAARTGVELGQLQGSLGADPLASQLRGGAAFELTDLVTLAGMTRGTEMTSITVDGTVYHDAGGSDADELAAVASVAVEYLRVLSDGGVDDPFAQLEFRYAVGPDQFGSIAKLRAARRIWSRIAELSGASGRQRQHAVTSSAMMTRRDPWTNMLRSTIACFAAAAGGAASITVAPFDSALGQPDDFARRIARNTHAVVRDEAGLARVVDPTAGSWYVETLTEQLAEVAWKKFAALERGGGAAAAVASGAITAMVAPARDARLRNIATRRDPITGVSVFPAMTEQPVVRLPWPAAPAAALVPTLRYAQEFEALRDRCDAHTASTGRRPSVTLTAFGPASAYGPRVSFARDVFEVAGIEPVVITGDAHDLVEAYQATGTPVTCLCSTNELYAEQARTVADSLRKAGAQHIVLAGRPIGGLDVDDYVFVGSDVLAVLRSTLTALGVA